MAHQVCLPARIAHWGPPDPRYYRVVEPDLGQNEALDFAERYAEVMRQSGWRTILDLPPRYEDPSFTPDSSRADGRVEGSLQLLRVCYTLAVKAMEFA